MAKNQSLPARLQKKDSRGEDDLTPCMKITKNPPPSDQGLAFQTHALQMMLFGSFYVRTQHRYGSLRIVPLQLAPSVGRLASWHWWLDETITHVIANSQVECFSVKSH